jgi:hypothetical protein
MLTSMSVGGQRMTVWVNQNLGKDSSLNYFTFRQAGGQVPGHEQVVTGVR